MVYLDYAATSPMSEAALETYEKIARQYYGNASSLHEDGWMAKQVLDNARAMIAHIAGVEARGIYFTGSGTEANLIGIMSLALASTKRHIITSMAEHTSVHAAMNALERMGYRVTRLPLQQNGLIDCALVERTIDDDTCLLALQHINPEIGSIQPIAQLAEIARRHEVLLHVDCVQSFAKVPLDFVRHIDSFSCSAHKIGGPKSCGAVYIKPGSRIVPLFPGLTHEKGLRGGTVDVAANGAFAVAAEACSNQTNHRHFTTLRNVLKKRLAGNKYTLLEASVQYPGICGLLVHGYEGQYVMLRLSERGVMVSTGSACDSSHEAGTKAIMAMGASVDEARQFFRISFGTRTTIKEIEILCEILNDF